MIHKNLIVKKTNDLNQANFATFTLSVYRVFLIVVSKLQQHDLMTGELISLNQAKREHTLTVSEYAYQFGIDGNTAYNILRLAVDKLLNTQFKIINISGEILKINICSQAYYRKSLGLIDIKFTDDIMPHLVEVSQQFTMYNLSDIAGFNSIYTTRLYELLMQYKTTGILKISVENLRFTLGCVNVLKQYNHFKVKAINHAVKEINQNFMMKLSFIEIKTGKLITEVHFNFLAVFHNQVYDVVKQKIRTQVGKHKKLKK